jgi:hypothetical protein
MSAGPRDVAQVRLENALLLFEEFVRATARHADPATLRGLEGRFAERVQIQPSYWSQIKGRSRQIGERLARQFELHCHKPAGWMDQPHHGASAGAAPTALSGVSLAGAAGMATGTAPSEHASESLPRDDDERFIVGLVLTYYRRHPQRARTRLLDLLGEVLIPSTGTGAVASAAASAGKTAAAIGAPLGAAKVAPAADALELWRRTQTGIAPLKRRK